MVSGTLCIRPRRFVVVFEMVLGSRTVHIRRGLRNCVKDLKDGWGSQWPLWELEIIADMERNA